MIARQAKMYVLFEYIIELCKYTTNQVFLLVPISWYERLIKYMHLFSLNYPLQYAKRFVT